MTDRVHIATVTRVTDGQAATDHDLVAVELPIEIVLAPPAGAPLQSLGLLMRTPGDDADLVMGLLVTEQIISSPADVLAIEFANHDEATPDGGGDRQARATVRIGPGVDLSSLTARRALTRSSACGLCGQLAMRAVRLAGGGRSPDRPAVDSRVILSIPGQLRRGQRVFAETGGLHAAAFCDLTGTPWLLHEDVGRHNAVDKVVGAAFAAGRLPAIDSLLAVSGRVAYEIVQKAAVAGVVGIVAVGAPSSLAVDAARAAGLTLAAFVRDGRFNVYAGHERVRLTGENSATP